MQGGVQLSASRTPQAGCVGQLHSAGLRVTQLGTGRPVEDWDECMCWVALREDLE